LAISLGGGDLVCSFRGSSRPSSRVFAALALRRPQTTAIAPDASFFVTADQREILVWPGPAQWPDMICSKLVWNMSRKQWREWVSPVIPYQEQCPGLKIAPD
jgi:hypothetical protein